MSVLVYNSDSANQINDLLHKFAEYIIGRMGIPYREKGVSIISIVLDAPNDVIGSLSGKIGMLPEVTVKTVYSKV